MFPNDLVSEKKKMLMKPKENGPVRMAESWLKLAGFVREKHCLTGLMNSDLSGKPAGWSELFRPANRLNVILAAVLKM